MDQLLAVHAESRPGVRFVRVEAEALPELSERYEVAAVPFFVALKGGAVAASLEGADAEALDAMVVAHFGGAQNVAAKKPMSLNDRLAGLIASHPVMLFMKGSPAEPRCVPGGGAGGGGPLHGRPDAVRPARLCACVWRANAGAASAGRWWTPSTARGWRMGASTFSPTKTCGRA